MHLQSLSRRIFSYGTVSTATLAAMFLFHIVAGRYLGVVDYGRFSLALTLSMMFAPMLDPGLYYLLIREIAKDKLRASSYVSHALSWRLFCGPAFLVLIIVVAASLRDSSVMLYAALLLGCAQILRSSKDALRPALLGLEKLGLDALSLTLERFGLLIVCGLVLWFGGNLIALCWAFLIVRVVDLAFTFGITTRHVPIRFSIDRFFLWSMLRAALPIGAFYITLNIYNYIDVAMLAALRGDMEVGWYSAAYRLYEGPILIPTVIGTVFMPVLSRLYVQDRYEFVSALRKGVKWVVGASAIVMIVGIAISSWVISISYGAEYSNSAKALKILLTGAAFAFTINFFQIALISIDRQKFVLIVAVIGLVANISLNALLIPKFGFLGASIATVVAELIACILLSAIIFRTIRSREFLDASTIP